MAASKLPIEIEQGATFKKMLTWKAGAPPVPVDLTGCKARMHVRERMDSPLPMLSLTTENSGIALGGADGTITVRADADKTSLLSKRTGVYDLEIEFIDGTVRRLIYGPVVISPGVTRD